MIVSGADHGVADAAFGGETASDLEDIVVEEPDGIDDDETEASNTVVENGCHGPEIIVNGGGGAILAKPGEPDGFGGIGEVGVDFVSGEADLQCGEGGPGTCWGEVDIGACSGVTIAERVKATCGDHQSGEQDDAESETERPP